MLPLNFVKGRGFQDFTRHVEPNYKVPSCQTITKRVELLYEEAAAAKKTTLQSIVHVATAEAWTAPMNDSYMTITCHYIDWTLQIAQGMWT